MTKTRIPRWLAGALILLSGSTLSCNPTRPAQPPPVEDPRPAHISFLSNPEGASVRLNGTLLEGTTPLEYQEVPAGLNVIEFEKRGYRPLRTQRYWDAGALTRLDVTLEPLATPTPTSTPTETPTREVPTQLAPATVSTKAATRPPTPAPARTLAPVAVAPTIVSKPATAYVSLISNPPGATITVNGQPMAGAAPLVNTVLPAGKAVVEFSLPNYEPARVEREWLAGGKDRVAVALVPLPARLSVHTTPGGATVKVNGVIVEGKTPIDNAMVPAGATDMLIELENYVPHTERKALAANGEARFEVALKPLAAVVRFESDPPGATIIVNDKPLAAKAPAGPLPMTPGHARIEFQLENHNSRVIERDWTPNGEDAVMVKLAAKPGRAQFESASAWESLTVDGKVAAVAPGGWLALSAGTHRVLAQQGDRAAETEFIVPPAGDVVVSLNWANVRPTLTAFVELPAIKATLGDQRFADSNPIHPVELPAFWIARREVTVDEYRPCVHAALCATPGTDTGCNWGAADRGKHPINCVSAKDAEAYAAWLAQRTGIPYRLPTTDEWERAARGSGDRAYPWGNEPVGARCNSCDRACGIERFRDESFDDGRPETAPVGTMAYCSSSDGVIDLVGNVAEWTRAGAGSETMQVRGGSWAQNGLFLEPALAVVRPATDRDPMIGFRLMAASNALPLAPPSTPTPVNTATPAVTVKIELPESNVPAVKDTPADGAAPDVAPQ